MQHHLHFPFHHHKPHAARYDVDMTQGSTTGHLIRFALPLLAGNLFQQLYNMVDTWVVGNFVVSNEAFSAVGTKWGPLSTPSSASFWECPAAPAWSSASITVRTGRKRYIRRYTPPFS